MNLSKLVLFLFFLVFSSYFLAILFLPGTNYVFYLKPLLIPIFLGYAVLKYGFIFPKRYLFFVLFFYLGETLMLYSGNSNTVLQLALVFYIMFYFALAYLPLSLISGSPFKKIFNGVTLFVISLNAFFLFLIVYIIFETTTDTLMNIIVVFNAISALMLMICALVFMSVDASKKSFLYFLGSIAVILSDVFSAINVYYLYVFELNVLEIILHFVGFYLIYLFIIEKLKPDAIDV